MNKEKKNFVVIAATEDCDSEYKTPLVVTTEQLKLLRFLSEHEYIYLEEFPYFEATDLT